MDYGPGRKLRDPMPRYWFWDFDSPEGSHTLGLSPDQVISIDPTIDAFDPAEFVAWPPSWFISRDWGKHS